jgi:uncharacterized protein YjiS (DUF1127 family)
MELAMGTMSLSRTTVRSRPLPHWSELRAVFIEWRQRVHSRYALMMLDDRELWDMGLTRGDVDNEVNKPFWRP